MRSSGWKFVWGLVLAAGFVAPGLGLAVVVWVVPDRLAGTVSRPVPVSVAVQTTSGADSVPVAVNLVWRGGMVLRAPGWQGLVTSVGVGAGSEVSDGTVVATVGGVERVGVVSPAPFYRVIGPGVSGGDVAELRGVLTSLGYAKLGSSTSYDSSLGDAIRWLYKKLSGQASGSGGVFQPSWFVWLPGGPLVAGKVSLTVDTPAPPAGVTVITGVETLSSATVVPAGGPGSPGLPSSPAGRVLVVSRVAHPLSLTSGWGVTAGALGALGGALPAGQAQVSGTVRLASPASYASVPNSAVSLGAAGQACVWAPTGHGYTPYEVSTLPGLPGTTWLSGLPGRVASVLANPAQVLPGGGGCP
ncbi:MAG: hypothetical protein ACP5P1_14865 [Acidimicrobiales bacterium]